MKKHKKFSMLLPVAVITLMILSAGCAVNHIRRAEDYRRNKSYEEALGHYLEALQNNPDSIDLKIDIDHLLKEASIYYYKLASEQEKIGKKEVAVLLYQKSLEFDPANNQTRQAMRDLLQPGETAKDIEIIKKEMEINVGLPDIFKDPERIDLRFTSKVSLMKIFSTLAKAGKVNILFDSGFKDKQLTLSPVQLTFHEALEQVCLLNKCSYYVLDSNNIVITPEAADSRKRFQRLLMKNLYFSNLEAEEAKSMIESVILFKKQMADLCSRGALVLFMTTRLCEQLSFTPEQNSGLEITDIWDHMAVAHKTL